MCRSGRYACHGPVAEASDFRLAFDVLDADADRDGKIDREDLRAFYSGLLARPSEEDISSMIVVADADRDGFVQLDEFERVLGRREGGGVMEEVFWVMDRDGDRKVGFEDLKGYLRWAGMDVSDDDVRAMIRVGGGEKANGVDFDELLKILAVDFSGEL